MPGFGADNHEATSAECVSLGYLERLEAGGIAIVRGNDLARPLDAEAHAIVGPRHGCPLRIDDPHGHKCEVAAVSRDSCTVNLGLQHRGLAGGAHGIARPL